MEYRIAERGQELDLGDGVIMQILSPTPASRDVDPNTHSVVVRVIYGKTAFVLPADADSETESEILASGHPVRAQVLQVGHHGSATASKPRVAGCHTSPNCRSSPAADTTFMVILPLKHSLGFPVWEHASIARIPTGRSQFLSDGTTITAKFHVAPPIIVCRNHSFYLHAGARFSE